MWRKCRRAADYAPESLKAIKEINTWLTYEGLALQILLLEAESDCHPKFSIEDFFCLVN